MLEVATPGVLIERMQIWSWQFNVHVMFVLPLSDEDGTLHYGSDHIH